MFHGGNAYSAVFTLIRPRAPYIGTFFISGIVFLFRFMPPYPHPVVFAYVPIDLLIFSSHNLVTLSSTFPTHYPALYSWKQSWITICTLYAVLLVESNLGSTFVHSTLCTVQLRAIQDLRLYSLEQSRIHFVHCTVESNPPLIPK